MNTKKIVDIVYAVVVLICLAVNAFLKLKEYIERKVEAARFEGMRKGCEATKRYFKEKGES